MAINSEIEITINSTASISLDMFFATGTFAKAAYSSKGMQMAFLATLKFAQLSYQFFNCESL